VTQAYIGIREGFAQAPFPSDINSHIETAL
jgi:hypothetical protein